jgi:hypothetical protein
MKTAFLQKFWNMLPQQIGVAHALDYILNKLHGNEDNVLFKCSMI